MPYMELESRKSLATVTTNTEALEKSAFRDDRSKIKFKVPGNPSLPIQRNKRL